jgi:hypothetical protein
MKKSKRKIPESNRNPKKVKGKGKADQDLVSNGSLTVKPTPKKIEIPVEPPEFEKVDTRLSLDEADQRMAVSSVRGIECLMPYANTYSSGSTLYDSVLYYPYRKDQ